MDSRRTLGGVAGWLDDRTGAAKPIGHLLRKVFPDHWSFMLGELALYSLLVLLVTGTFLTVWFVPSSGTVVYGGSYAPLRGLTVSEAYRSTVDMSFDVRGGLLIRQVHHWAALLFTVAIAVHMMRVFFTGAFRKPRELNWVIGVSLSLLAIVEGFAGYSLPDDLLSGTGLRIANGLMLSIPVIGSWLAFAVFGGQFPGDDIIPRLYVAHILLIPTLLVGLALVHVLIVVVQKHTQFAGPGRTNRNVVGFRLMPTYLAKAGGFFFIVFGVTALIAALVTINPIWMFGPYDPTAASAGSQPDWYMGFAEGALRLMLPWEIHAFGHTLSLNVLLPGVLLIPVMYAVTAAYPFIERWATRAGPQEHHLIDRPRSAPTRTAIGAGALTFYVGLFLAGGNDIIALKLHLSIEAITWSLRILVVLAPLVVGWTTRRICLSLQSRDRATVLKGRETGTLVRTAGGGFFEAHRPLSTYEQWRLVAHGQPDVAAGDGQDERLPTSDSAEDAPDRNVLGTQAARLHVTGLRGRLSRAAAGLYFSDQVPTPSPPDQRRAEDLLREDHDALRHERVGGPNRLGRS
ncbi:ubiquinol-cytochrome c reductase cytochrome b subunit [Phycicoccus sp. Root563]|uniref:cytochrome bc1 complex cytochrome b subunit n=1 Tax=Phycicoccus sp. Root563 TaxID=1736562 RepID=UPI000AA4B515|nr:ubiquinol-cytochrome c reductase cytochrome b subunit [Phycicoccus sp. Root563]